MKILSIDVGIKNLAYCLLEKTHTDNDAAAHGTAAHADDTADNGYAILKWDVLNLCGKPPTCNICNKPAKYTGKKMNETNTANILMHFCATHAKKSEFKIPEAALTLKKIKAMKLIQLNEIVKDFHITLPASHNKKEQILKEVIHYMDTKMLSTTTSVAANSVDLVSLGIALQQTFDEELKNELATIDQIIIENQISPIANRMKTLQGMIAQYFIMRNKTKIVFVSSANKLKGYDMEEDACEGEKDKTSYSDRKKAGVKITLAQLNEHDLFAKWIPHFKTHKKKDDLADAFLQGIWYLKTRCM
jgi:hypothetical protein